MKQKYEVGFVLGNAPLVITAFDDETYRVDCKALGEYCWFDEEELEDLIIEIDPSKKAEHLRNQIKNLQEELAKIETK